MILIERQKQNPVQTTKMTKHFSVLANMSDCCLFTNHKFRLTMFFLIPIKLFLYPATELPTLSENLHSRLPLYTLPKSHLIQAWLPYPAPCDLLELRSSGVPHWMWSPWLWQVISLTLFDGCGASIVLRWWYFSKGSDWKESKAKPTGHSRPAGISTDSVVQSRFLG